MTPLSKYPGTFVSLSQPSLCWMQLERSALWTDFSCVSFATRHSFICSIFCYHCVTKFYHWERGKACDQSAPVWKQDFPKRYLKKPRSLKILNAQILKPQVHCCIFFYKLSDSSDKIHEEGESRMYLITVGIWTNSLLRCTYLWLGRMEYDSVNWLRPVWLRTNYQVFL